MNDWKDHSRLSSCVNAIIRMTDFITPIQLSVNIIKYRYTVTNKIICRLSFIYLTT